MAMLTDDGAPGGRNDALYMSAAVNGFLQVPPAVNNCPDKICVFFGVRPVKVVTLLSVLFIDNRL